MALERAQDEAAKKWLEAGAKGRPQWALRESRRVPMFGIVVFVAVLVLVVAIVVGFAA
ncbi:MAG: hypothetical protein ACRD0A_06515 [Acidimicrobiales bacterium]